MVARLAIDMMSADSKVDDLISGIALFLATNQAKLQLVGNSELLNAAICNNENIKPHSDHISVIHAEEVILQTDNPLQALRHKRKSSTHVAVNQVVTKEADAVVSCANTGAYVAICKYLLKLVPGVERMALMGSFPTYPENHDVYIADIGAGVDASPNHLLQYAKMGQAYLAPKAKMDAVRVGLLSNGVEKIKGNMLTQAAHKLLSAEEDINYLGYVEGHDLFSGDYDLVVCDGFVGNTVLKSCEGAALFIQSTIKSALQASWLGQSIAFPLKTVLSHYGPKLQPQKRNGGLLLGVQGIVVKSHGNSDAKAFANALGIASQAVANNAIENMCASIPSTTMCV